MFDLPDMRGLAFLLAVGMISSCAGVLWLVYFVISHIRFI